MTGKKQNAKSILPDNANRKLFEREVSEGKDLSKLKDMRDNIESYKSGETYEKSKDFREVKYPAEEMKNDFNVHSGIKIEAISHSENFRNLSSK